MENQDLEKSEQNKDVKQPKIKKKDFENVRKMLKSYGKFNMDKYKELIGFSSGEKKKELKNKATEEDQFLCSLSSKIKVIGDHYLKLKVLDELVELTDEEKYLLNQFYFSEQARLQHTAYIVREESDVVNKWRKELEKSFHLMMMLKDENEKWIFQTQDEHSDNDDKECQDLYLI